MTIQELYNWAVENNMLDAEIEYHDGDCGGTLPASIVNIIDDNTVELECN